MKVSQKNMTRQMFFKLFAIFAFTSFLFLTESQDINSQFLMLVAGGFFIGALVRSSTRLDEVLFFTNNDDAMKNKQ